MQLRYVIDYSTGLYVVCLIGTEQRIVVQPAALIRYARVSPRAVLGSTTVTPVNAAKLGFLVNGDHVHLTIGREGVSA